MSLLTLAARVCRAFSDNVSQDMLTVQKVKDGQSRDIVTALDMKLHALSCEFVLEKYPHCRLLSEEGGIEGVRPVELLTGEWFVVDPLDGSNNYAFDIPNFGYMAAHLKDGRSCGAVVVLPEHGQYIVWEDGRSLYAKSLPIGSAGDHGTVYYAYPPKLDDAARKTRGALLNLIDIESAGMYRYGSACAGLYQLLCGKHKAFIGHGIRLWDAIAFLPILESRKIKVKYAIDNWNITLIAGSEKGFSEKVEKIFKEEQNIFLREYHNQFFEVQQS
jgi:myo-inositol-1(or 4)-monophosphatase